MESLSPRVRSHAEKGNQLVSNMPACVRVFNKYTHKHGTASAATFIIMYLLV